MIAPLEYATVEAGLGWDAVRIPEQWARRVLAALQANSADLAALGPIVLSERSECTYWLVPTGTRPEDWPDECRLLTRGHYLTLPDETVDRRCACSIHRPHGTAQLTAAAGSPRPSTPPGDTRDPRQDQGSCADPAVPGRTGVPGPRPRLPQLQGTRLLAPLSRRVAGRAVRLPTPH